MKGAVSLLAVCVLIGAFPNGSSAADVRKKEPGATSKGRVYEWESAAGVAYHYFIPKNYDPEQGAALTFVLHGSNLSKGWGFANHKPGEFRPDDIVVCPDGTTANGKGGFNFLGREEDIGRFEALHDELKESLQVNATYLYGHSQGSFFALHYAGAKPDAVDGVLAQASGVWAATRRGSKGHHQAIVFMHGTQDPVVPYGQSVGALKAYQEGGYPNVRLKSLEGWNHWPAELNGPVPQASRQLAWIEGMSSDIPARVGAAFRALNDPSDKQHRDFQALYLLSARILKMPDLGGKAEARAKEVMEKIDALASTHIANMRAPRPGDVDGLVAESWVGHLPIFLRAFRGVPAADAFAEDWQEQFETQKTAAIEQFGIYRKSLGAGDKKTAFEAGLAVLTNAFLTHGAADSSFLKNMEAWAGDRSLDIPKDDIKAFKTLLKDYRDALEDGAQAFGAENKRARI